MKDIDKLLEFFDSLNCTFMELKYIWASASTSRVIAS